MADDANDILTIDGIVYAVNIVSFDEIPEFADKYAERTEDWDLQRELAGIFFNYELVLGDIQDTETMQAVYDKLTEFVPFHDLTLPHNDETWTFKAYPKIGKRSLLKRKNGVNRWGGITINFIAKKPQITE